ncbi:MAG: SPFH domain-containing protein [Prevotellaceae bacterium]|jgi:regulator of protease activity HflC (stomatin/prohibitin superfamily)|nr:SPFH domain-containing protein [Prevotellaceae bacterium]
MNSKEYLKKPVDGYAAITLIIFLCIILGLGAAYFAMNSNPATLACIFCILVILLCLKGLNSINPNTAAVLTLFGKYKGTIVEDGLCWINPFMQVRKISMKARSLNGEPIKVNDSMGNPILIGIVIVWKVENTFKSVFEVEDCLHFVSIQSEAAIRSLAGAYSYDNIDEENAGITLRGGGEEVNLALEKALVERLRIAGVQVIEARINYLAYAPEIAGAMLQRQQATAVVAARQKIVEGAVSMVEMALEQLSARNIIELDDEKKAAMVSNLMVVLTSDKSASPVLNAGTLY